MLFNCTVTATLLSVKMYKNTTACIKSVRRCNIIAVSNRFLKIFVRCNLQKKQNWVCLITQLPQLYFRWKCTENATTCLKSTRRCNIFAVSNRFLKIFVRCNLQKKNWCCLIAQLPHVNFKWKWCKNATACLKMITKRFAILFARGFWMKFTKRQHAKSSALSKNRVRPFRHVAKFVQEK